MYELCNNIARTIVSWFFKWFLCNVAVLLDARALEFSGNCFRLLDANIHNYLDIHKTPARQWKRGNECCQTPVINIFQCFSSYIMNSVSRGVSCDLCDHFTCGLLGKLIIAMSMCLLSMAGKHILQLHHLVVMWSFDLTWQALMIMGQSQKQWK